MKIILLSLCVALACSMPTNEDDHREGRNIFTNFLGNIGILKVIPRECSTTSTFLGKGMCSLESSCTEVGGAIAGACERAGVCCVVPAVCGSQVTVKRSWFVNKEFPGTIPEAYPEECALRILKSDETIRQVRFDFSHFVIEDSTDGKCETDSFRVTREGLEGEEDVIPVLCGDNSGQHAFVDFPSGELGEIKVRIRIGSSKVQNPHRSWRVYITQLDDTEMAPKGCLQYYDEKAANIRSLNYDASDSNFVLNTDYDICFKKVEDFKLEADENLTDRTSFNVCGRVFSNVKLEQSFVPGSTNVIASNGRNKRETKSAKVELDNEKNSKPVGETVVSQIQQVVSQLQKNTDSKAKDEKEKTELKQQQSKKTANEKKETAKAEATTDKKPVKAENEPEKKLATKTEEAKPVLKPVAKPVAKPAAEPAAKPVAKPVAKPIVKPTKATGKVPEKTDEKENEVIKESEKTTNEKPEVITPINKADEDKITWLILSDGSVKDSSKFNQDAAAGLKPIKEVPAEEPSVGTIKITPETTTTKRYPVVTEKSTEAQPTSTTKAPEMKPENTQTTVTKSKPMESMSNVKAPATTVQTLNEPEPEPEVQFNLISFTRSEAEQKFLTRIGCDGVYLLANDRKMCGSFHRRNIPQPTQIQIDSRLRNADRMSYRSIENPQTSLRFSLGFNINCRTITTTTSTTTTTTTTTTPAPTTVSTTTEPNRRFGILQYLLGNRLNG